MRSFGDQESSVEIALPNGWRVSMRKYVDLGLQRDLYAYLTKLNAKDDGDRVTRGAKVQAGGLFIIQKLITKVVTPERTFFAPLGLQLLRTMDDGPSLSELIRIVNQNNEEAAE